MKRIFFHLFICGLVSVLLTILLSGCSDYFDNPLKDKDTGEDIHLLVLDFNFFDTRISVKLLDAANGQLIHSSSAVRFSGINGNDIVTFSGNKKGEFTTSEGQIEVAVDPNIVIAENSPFSFSVSVEAEGYNSFSKSIQFTSAGKKTIELNLNKIDDEEELDLEGGMEVENGDTSFVFFVPINLNVKSAREEIPAYEVKYKISLGDFLLFKDSEGNLLFQSKEEVLSAYNSNPETFIVMSISKFTGYAPEIDVVNLNGGPVPVIFHKLETGRMTSLQVNGKYVADLNGGVINSWCQYIGLQVPDVFGFAVFINSSWTILGTEVVYTQTGFNYTVVEASTEPLCPSGSTITFRSGAISSFSIDADVFDSDDKLLTTLHFKGNFPETFTVENTPRRAVKLVFRNNNPSFQPVAPLLIADFCTGNYDVNVLPSEGYEEYQIVLKAFCPDNPAIAVAPTYSGEFKIKGIDNPWQGVDMVGGVVDLLGLPNMEYQLRMLWEDEWEYSTLFTEFDENGNYLHPNSSKIHSGKLPDGRTRINIEHTYSQSVCSDMGW